MKVGKAVSIGFYSMMALGFLVPKGQAGGFTSDELTCVEVCGDDWEKCVKEEGGDRTSPICEKKARECCDNFLKREKS